MTPIQDACKALTTLIPALTPALPKDQGHTRTTQPNGSVPFNPDVMHAIVTVEQEIPDTTTKARAAIGEPATGFRPALAECLRQLPRLHNRLLNLNHATEAAELERAAAYWVRVTKNALGLRTPDIPIGYPCPYHQPFTGLLAAGAEGFLRPGAAGTTVEWAHAATIYCPHCGTSWGPSEWMMLGRILEQAS